MAQIRWSLVWAATLSTLVRWSWVRRVAIWNRDRSSDLRIMLKGSSLVGTLILSLVG